MAIAPGGTRSLLFPSSLVLSDLTMPAFPLRCCSLFFCQKQWLHIFQLSAPLRNDWVNTFLDHHNTWASWAARGFLHAPAYWPGVSGPQKSVSKPLGIRQRHAAAGRRGDRRGRQTGARRAGQKWGCWSGKNPTPSACLAANSNACASPAPWRWYLIDKDIEKTISNLGSVGSTGMEMADDLIQKIMVCKY